MLPSASPKCPLDNSTNKENVRSSVHSHKDSDEDSVPSDCGGIEDAIMVSHESSVKSPPDSPPIQPYNKTPLRPSSIQTPRAAAAVAAAASASRTKIDPRAESPLSSLLQLKGHFLYGHGTQLHPISSPMQGATPSMLSHMNSTTLLRRPPSQRSLSLDDLSHVLQHKQSHGPLMIQERSTETTTSSLETDLHNEPSSLKHMHLHLHMHMQPHRPPYPQHEMCPQPEGFED
jgi:hypothetical protein